MINKKIYLYYLATLTLIYLMFLRGVEKADFLTTIVGLNAGYSYIREKTDIASIIFFLLPTGIILMGMFTSYTNVRDLENYLFVRTDKQKLIYIYILNIFKTICIFLLCKVVVDILFLGNTNIIETLKLNSIYLISLLIWGISMLILFYYFNLNVNMTFIIFLSLILITNFLNATFPIISLIPHTFNVNYIFILSAKLIILLIGVSTAIVLNNRNFREDFI